MTIHQHDNTPTQQYTNTTIHQHNRGFLKALGIIDNFALFIIFVVSPHTPKHTHKPWPAASDGNKEGNGKGAKSDGYGNEEGNGDGGKIDGNSNKEGNGEGWQ
jgi:hypothetical protein